MDLLRRLPIPKRLAARVWLVTLPSALLSFERRQRIPKLPAGRARLLGVPAIAAGAVLILRARATAAPAAVGGGLLALGGAGILMRSLLLIAYAAGLAVAFAREAIELEDPRLPGGAAPDEPSFDYDETII